MPGVGTTHHVEIGGHYYMVRPGSYSKRVAPQFGARMTTGDPDYNNLSMWQHWAQKCFIGGAGQDEFADDAMFDEAIGVDTTSHEKFTLSRDLEREGGSNWGFNAGNASDTFGYRACIYNNVLYVVTFATAGVDSKLWYYSSGVSGWVNVAAFTGVCACSIAAFDGKLYIGGQNTAGSAGIIKYASGALGTWNTVTNPAGVGALFVTAMRSFQSKLYCSFGANVWRLKDDLTWDGTTVFYKANQNSETNGMVDFEVHLGNLYMLSQNGHLHRTDGNTSFDMWSWDGQTEGVAIRSFDGRLFILTFEYTNSTNLGYSVLYQMSGSAMTQLKRYGTSNRATRIGNMVTYDRKMFYGASNLLGFGGTRLGFGVACYDPIEDAHSIMASTADTVTYASGALPYANYIVDDQIFYGGFLYCFVRGHGAFRTPYAQGDLSLGTSASGGLRHFDVTSAGGSLIAQNGGWLSTSTYDAGTVGVRKLWRKITIDVSIPTNCGVVLDYSINNGSTWVTVGTFNTVTSRGRFEAFLNNVISTSLKLRFTLRSTDLTSTPVFYGFAVSYLPTIEPNWLWTMTLMIVDKVVLLDGTAESMSTESELTFLGDAFRTKQLVHLTDAEGESWASNGNPGVLIYDMTMQMVALNQPLEAWVTVSLLEAVETY